MTELQVADPRPFTPTIGDMEAEYYGVLITTLGEHGDMAIAVTDDHRKALAALNRYYREICGHLNCLNRPQLTQADAYQHMDSRTVLFLKAPPEEADEWAWMTVPAGDSPHGIHVTRFHPYPIPTDLTEEDWT